MASLTLMITNECNLECSFCIQEEMMSECNLNHEKFLSTLDEILSKDDYNSFTISGGEPLADINWLEYVLNFILDRRPNASIQINTNGTHLNPRLVDIFNSIENLSFRVSVDGIDKRERSLFRGISDNYTSSFITARSIQRLKRKVIHFVVTNNKFSDVNLATEIALIQAYFDCTVEISIDVRDEVLAKFSVMDVYQISLLVQRLQLLGLSRDSFRFTFAGLSGCSGELKCKEILPSGKIKENCLSKGECVSVKSKMPLGVYEVYSRIVNANNPNTYEGQARLEDKFNYDSSKYYEYDRDIRSKVEVKALQPNKIHPKFSKLNQISFKQVD